jgi:hypothetical protein
MKHQVYFCIFFISATVIVACNPIPDKSITEPIKPKELSKIFQKDSAFESTYEFVELGNILILNTKVKKAQYYDLTYRDFHDFYLLANEKSPYYKELENLFWEEYEQLSNSYQPRIDSLINSVGERQMADANYRYPFLVKEMMEFLEEEGGKEVTDYPVVYFMLIQDYLNADFESYSEYSFRNLTSILMEKDSLSAKYWVEVADKISQIKE